MPSPFPGMDPYLEKHWGDIHARLITYACDSLQRQLPKDLRARVEERIVVAGADLSRSFFPDVRVFESKGKPRRARKPVSAVAAAEPLVIELDDEPETQTFIEIRDVVSGSHLITVIELLSPSNKKPGDGQEQYLRKQRELLKGGVSLVELDLLRTGDWIVALPHYSVVPEKRTPYRVVVRRGWQPLRAEYYPIALQTKLPAIRVPLRPTDEDAQLDLQSLLEQCYENGAYDDIDYTRSADPPLAPSLSRWAASLLRRKGHRPRRSSKH